jgi:dUTP pyrophosphatase
MKIQVIKTTTNELPSYGSVEAAGCDLRADLWSIKEKFLFDTEIVRNEDSTVKGLLIHPGGRALISTGLQIALPVGYEAQIRPRSGLALKNGISVVNSPGTIDSDYRGDIGIILINHGFEPFMVEQGDRIAQMVIVKHEQAEFVEVQELDETSRGDGGFGHTGTI